MKIVHREGCFIQFDQAPDEKGIVIQVCRDGRLPVPITVQNSPIRGVHCLQDEIRSSTGRLKKGIFIKNLGGFGKSSDHQTVPVRQDFVVPMRTNSLISRLKKFLLCLVQLPA